MHSIILSTAVKSSPGEKTDKNVALFLFFLMLKHVKLNGIDAFAEVKPAKDHFTTLLTFLIQQ